MLLAFSQFINCRKMILPPLYSNFTPKLNRAPLQLKLSRKKGTDNTAKSGCGSLGSQSFSYTLKPRLSPLKEAQSYELWHTQWISVSKASIPLMACNVALEVGRSQSRQLHENTNRSKPETQIPHSRIQPGERLCIPAKGCSRFRNFLFLAHKD